MEEKATETMKPKFTVLSSEALGKAEVQKHEDWQKEQNRLMSNAMNTGGYGAMGAGRGLSTIPDDLKVLVDENAKLRGQLWKAQAELIEAKNLRWPLDWIAGGLLSLSATAFLAMVKYVGGL